MLVNPRPRGDDEVRVWLETQEERWGFRPNYAAAFVSRPDVAQAWMALGAAVSSGVDRRRFELATIAAARARRSTYCTAAHSMVLRDVCSDEGAMRGLAEHPDGSTLDATDHAVVTFATKVAEDPASITAEDVDALRAAGLTDDDIADVVFAVAARCFFATVLDGMGATVDPQIASSFDPTTLAHLTVGRPLSGSGPPVVG
jgi:uncharacterized peroxidase-related enzyme